MSDTLGVAPAYFFEGAPGPELESGFAEDNASYVTEFLSTAEGLQLNKAFARIRDTKLRRRIVDLVSHIAETNGSAKP